MDRSKKILRLIILVLLMPVVVYGALGDQELSVDGAKLIFNNNSQTFSISASSSMSESVNYIWPVADGDPGQIIITDGAGVFSFADVNAVAGAHDILSVTHPDAVDAEVTVGDLIFGNATPKWDDLAIGASNEILRVSSGLPDWQATTFITELGTIVTGVWNAGGLGTFDSLNVDNGILAVNLPSYLDRVGVRTATPSYPLHVPWISGDTLSTAFFGSANASNNQIAVLASSYSNNAIYGVSQTSYGIYGTTTSSTLAGVKGYNESGGPGLEGSVNPLTTDSVETVMELYRKTSGTAEDGIGGSLDFYLENDNGDDEAAGRIAVSLIDVSDGSENSEMVISLRDGADPALTGAMTLNNVGLTVEGTISTANAITGGSFVASGDVDTQITFPVADRFQLEAGGLNFIYAYEGILANNRLLINADNANIDFVVETQGSANMFWVDGATDGVGVGRIPAQNVTFDVGGVTLVRDKIAFTQTDLAEYIDSLADGYMDYRATTAHRFGDGTNQLSISNTGVVTLEGSAKRDLTLRADLDYTSITAQGKPTQVSVGVAHGYSLPLYAANEELFFNENVPGRWDGASDITFEILVGISAAETAGEDFNLQFSWNNGKEGDPMPATSHDVEVETELLADRVAQYDLYFVSFVLDWDIDDPEMVEAHDDLVGRLRRIAVDGGSDEIESEIIVFDWHTHYTVDKMFKVPE